MENKWHKDEYQDMKKIIITDEDNHQHEGEIIFSFEENGDKYIIYEVNEVAYGAKIDDNHHLSPINDDEWPLVEKIYYQFLDDQEMQDEEDDDQDRQLQKKDDGEE